ncbi:MAG: hypothetical protein WC677_06930 [Clostridia bacterium]|jgi:hypothetical protein
MKKRILFLTIAFTLVFGSSVFANVKLNIQNPGFEDVKSGKISFWTTHAWDETAGITVFSIDKNIFHSGKNSMTITSNKTNDARYEQTIKVDSDSYYKFSCWIKTENVGTKAKGANVSVEGILDTSNAITGTSGTWKESILYGKTVANQKSLILSLGIGGYGSTNTGKAWFDDVKAQKLDKAPAGVYVAPLGQTNAPSNNDPNKSQTVNVSNVLVCAFIGVVIIIAIITFITNNKKKKLGKTESMTEEELDSDKIDENEETDTKSEEKENNEQENDEKENKEDDMNKD